MGRVLAIDYGGKRTGLAVSDPLQMIAGGLETVPTADLLPWLKRYMSCETVDRIVVGQPLMLNGAPSETLTSLIIPFVRKVEKEFPGMPVIMVDERFTSKIAAKAMADGGMKKKDRRNKGNIDRTSAVILLQGYLETIRP